MLSGFCLPVLKYCFAVWCPAVDISHFKTSGPRCQWCLFFTWCLFEFDIAYHQSGAVLCILCKIRSNPITIFITILTVCASEGYTRFFGRTSIYSLQSLAVPELSVSLWNDLSDPVFDGVELAWVKRKANAFFIILSCSFPFYLPLFLFSSFFP